MDFVSFTTTASRSISMFLSTFRVFKSKKISWLLGPFKLCPTVILVSFDAMCSCMFMSESEHGWIASFTTITLISIWMCDLDVWSQRRVCSKVNTHAFTITTKGTYFFCGKWILSAWPRSRWYRSGRLVCSKVKKISWLLDLLFSFVMYSNVRVPSLQVQVKKKNEWSDEQWYRDGHQW